MSLVILRSPKLMPRKLNLQCSCPEHSNVKCKWGSIQIFLGLIWFVKINWSPGSRMVGPSSPIMRWWACSPFSQTGPLKRIEWFSLLWWSQRQPSEHHPAPHPRLFFAQDSLHKNQTLKTQLTINPQTPLTNLSLWLHYICPGGMIVPYGKRR